MSYQGGRLNYLPFWEHTVPEFWSDPISHTRKPHNRAPKHLAQFLQTQNILYLDWKQCNAYKRSVSEKNKP